MTKKAEEVEEGVLPAVASEEGPGEVSLPSSSGARIDLSRIGWAINPDDPDVYRRRLSLSDVCTPAPTVTAARVTTIPLPGLAAARTS
jgi:hypothetical protein